MDKCPDAALLGTAKDAELAGRWGVSIKTVRRWRAARGIRQHGTGTDAHTLTGQVARHYGLTGKSAPLEDVDVTELGRVDFLELKLREIRAEAGYATGIAKANLFKLEREVYDDLERAKKSGDTGRNVSDRELAELVLSGMARDWARAVLARVPEGEGGAQS